MGGMPLWYLRSNIEKQKICHVEVVSENITWNCSCSPQVQVWAWRVQGCWTCAFVTLVPAIVNIWFRHARPWPGENKFPWCFLHKTILHHACFPSLLFFFFENLGRFCSNFCIPLLFVQNEKKKNSKLKREGRSIGDVLQPYFSPSLFFLCTFTKILYHFFSIQLVFVQG